LKSEGRRRPGFAKEVSEIMKQPNDTPNCQMHELLVTYLYGETRPEDSLKFESHLLECASCRQELSAFEGVRESLQQWQFDAAPNVHLVTAAAPQRSVLGLLKELFTLMPVWAKGLGAVAAAMLVLAVLGTDIQIGKEGFSYRADLLRRGNGATVQESGASPASSQIARIKLDEKQLEQVRASLMSEISARVAENEELQKTALKAQLVDLQTQLKDMRSADLVKLAAQIQQHRLKLQALERDIDRREGLGLTDILLGQTAASASGKTGGD
jgi:hypothetical protein